ncbi:MAG: hypothetical protein D6693_00450 [Planctomycetota bacterium]|nr:MAG: hypothetical protein D6693_00450 [Planctomycetota bacterium]
MDATAQRDGVGPGGDDAADARRAHRRLTVRAVRLSAAGAVMDTIEIDPAGEREALVAPALVTLGPADAAVNGSGGPRALRATQRSDTTPTEPWTPGREFVGRVAEPPADRPDLAGARVVADPDRVCGACDRCRSGLSAHCTERATMGAPRADGALRERLALPATGLVPVPDELRDDDAALALPVARALHAAWVVHLEGRPYVTVLGAGAEAVIAAQVMARLNASVRIVTEHDATLAAADRLRVRHRRLERVGRRGDQDVIVCVDSGAESLAVACAMVRPRGKIVTLAPASGPVALAPIVEHEITIVGCRGVRLREAVGALARGEIACDGLITHRFPFHRADAAVRAAADPGTLRVAVEM